jgi:hypothetical protein
VRVRSPIIAVPVLWSHVVELRTCSVACVRDGRISQKLRVSPQPSQGQASRRTIEQTIQATEVAGNIQQRTASKAKGKGKGKGKVRFKPPSHALRFLRQPRRPQRCDRRKETKRDETSEFRPATNEMQVTQRRYWTAVQGTKGLRLSKLEIRHVRCQRWRRRLIYFALLRRPASGRIWAWMFDLVMHQPS